MTPNIVCICCGCWICIGDDFNRPDGDVGTDSPLNWIPPATYPISGEQCVLNIADNLMVSTHEIDLINAQIYKVKVEIINDGGAGQLVLPFSFMSTESYLLGMYDAAAGSIHLYFAVGINWPADFYELNSQLITIVPKYFEVTFDMVNWIMEAAVEDSDGDRETCTSPLVFNGGTKVGLGALNIGAGITVDNYTLCWNWCEKGCLFGFDVFDREVLPTNDLGIHWIEDVFAAETDVIIIDNGGGDGIVRFNATRRIFWAEPHPDGHTTMGVGIRVFAYSIYEVLIGDPPPEHNEALAKAAWSGKFIKLLACVDDPNNPKEWVSGEYHPHNGSVKLFKAVGGVETEISGPSGPGSIGPGAVNDWFDLYLCVDRYGKVAMYGKNIHSVDWVAGAWKYVSGLTGTYCGMHCYGSPTNFDPLIENRYQRTYIDQFIALKTQHDGEPHIVEWTVGGTIETGDKFIIGIDPVDPPGVAAQITVTIAALAPTPEIVAQEIYDAIVDLDPVANTTLRSVSWTRPGDTVGKIRAVDQSKFNGIAITTENDNSAADLQTFTVETVQEWIKGAYNCPPCPEICGPCSYCTGDPPATPPNTDTPERVRVLFFGFNRIPGAGTDPGGCDGWNWPPHVHTKNQHDPPYPNFPGAFLCHDHMDHPIGYNGEYILEGCNCTFTFQFPTWFEWYYPDGLDPVAFPPFGWNPPEDQVTSETCYPGEFCNGFLLQATIQQDAAADPAGHILFWVLRLEVRGGGDLWAFWKSDNFPDTECKLPRTLHKWFPPVPPFYTPAHIDGAFPEEVQIIPEGSVHWTPVLP